VAVDETYLCLITPNPHNKREKEEQVIGVDLEEYACISQDEDRRDIFIDRIIR
jgi:hypothetical protein